MSLKTSAHLYPLEQINLPKKREQVYNFVDRMKN